MLAECFPKYRFLPKNILRLFIQGKVEIPLPETRLDVFHAVPLGRQGPKGFRKHHELRSRHALLSFFRFEKRARSRNKVADIENRLPKRKILRCIFFRYNLKFAGCIGKVKKNNIALIAYRGHPPHERNLAAFSARGGSTSGGRKLLKVPVRLRRSMRPLGSCRVWIDTRLSERFQLLPPFLD